MRAFNKMKRQRGRNTILSCLRKYGCEEVKRIAAVILKKERAGEIDSMEATIRLRALYKRQKEYYESKLKGQYVKGSLDYPPLTFIAGGEKESGRN